VLNVRRKSNKKGTVDNNFASLNTSTLCIDHWKRRKRTLVSGEQGYLRPSWALSFIVISSKRQFFREFYLAFWSGFGPQCQACNMNGELKRTGMDCIYCASFQVSAVALAYLPTRPCCLLTDSVIESDFSYWPCLTEITILFITFVCSWSYGILLYEILTVGKL